MNFNITEYVDEKLNRIGSKEDGKILEKTLLRKGFKLRVFRDGQMGKQTIVDKLKQYVKELKKDKRDVKVLVIAFMARVSAREFSGHNFRLPEPARLIFFN